MRQVSPAHRLVGCVHEFPDRFTKPLFARGVDALCLVEQGIDGGGEGPAQLVWVQITHEGLREELTQTSG